MDLVQPSLLFEHLYRDGVLPRSDLQGLSVSYGATAVSLGTQLEVADVSVMPAVVLPPCARKGAVRTLLMLDPDAPGPKSPTERSACLWAVTGITAHAKDLTVGRVLLEYQRPNPPLGNHRLVFALLEHDSVPPSDAPLRSKFALSTWAMATQATVTHANFCCVHAKESWGSSGVTKKRKRKN